jgi:hypothetical protein
MIININKDYLHEGKNARDFLSQVAKIICRQVPATGPVDLQSIMKRAIYFSAAVAI